MLEIIEAGLLSTVQDSGRPDQGHLGVARAGAADELALAVANLVVGNAPGAAALEMTLLGASFAVLDDVLVGLAGADMEAHVPEEDRRLDVGRSHHVIAGTTIVLGGATDGARTYLALPGGIRAESVLGSASTDPVAGFGGIEGRAARAGDRIGAVTSSAEWRERRWPGGIASSAIATGQAPRIVGVVEGPHLEAMPSGRDDLVRSSWTVTPRSDRVGLRLDGAALDVADVDLVSLPMLPGAVQVPPSGMPIVLMPDAPTVGGYPVPAVVPATERPITGQLRAGDEVRFEWIDVATARRRALDRARRLRAVAASLA